MACPGDIISRFDKATKGCNPHPHTIFDEVDVPATAKANGTAPMFLNEGTHLSAGAIEERDTDAKAHNLDVAPFHKAAETLEEACMEDSPMEVETDRPKGSKAKGLPKEGDPMPPCEKTHLPETSDPMEVAPENNHAFESVPLTNMITKETKSFEMPEGLHSNVPHPTEKSEPTASFLKTNAPGPNEPPGRVLPKIARAKRSLTEYDTKFPPGPFTFFRVPCVMIHDLDGMSTALEGRAEVHCNIDARGNPKITCEKSFTDPKSEWFPECPSFKEDVP